MFEVAKRFNQRLGVVLIAVVFLAGLVSAAWCAEVDYDGTYAGTYSGDDSGYWVGIIDSGGDSLYLSYSTVDDEGDGGYVYYDGESGTVGSFHSWSEMNGSYASADIDSSGGSVSGTWSNSYASTSGTITGSEVVSISHAGSYSGTFAGDDSGTWSMTIASNGYITGTISPESGGSYTFEGGCHPDGYIVAVGDSGGTAFAVFGRISGSSVTGGWESEDGYSGTISSGGSSDGGCFIMSLVGE
jgi:hypothetical protein